MKYAFVINDVIDTISYDPVDGWAEVGDDVFAGFVRNGDGWKAPPAPDVPPIIPTIIYKADIWRRATDTEAATIDAQLNAQPVRLRRMWQDSQTLAITDDMYPAVLSAFVSAFGATRANELLAPTA